MTIAPARRTGRRRPLLVAACFAVVLPVALACGSGGQDDASPPTDLGEVVDLTGRPEVTISVVDNRFVPQAFKVSRGTRIVFKNDGVYPHNVTPSTDGTFTKMDLAPSESGTLNTPSEPRTYRFFCSLHGSRTGGQRGAFVVV